MFNIWQMVFLSPPTVSILRPQDRQPCTYLLAIGGRLRSLFLRDQSARGTLAVGVKLFFIEFNGSTYEIRRPSGTAATGR